MFRLIFFSYVPFFLMYTSSVVISFRLIFPVFPLPVNGNSEDPKVSFRRGICTIARRRGRNVQCCLLYQPQKGSLNFLTVFPSSLYSALYVEAARSISVPSGHRN